MRAVFFISIGFIYIANNSSAQGSWTRRANFPELRYRAAAFSIGNKGYVGTGVFAPVGEFWEYDPTISAGTIENFLLDQNYPSPFNPSTTIRYQLPKSSRVSLKAFNTLGQEVAVLVDEEKVAGYYQVRWSAALPSGVYFYRLQAGEYLETKKMILL
jgi:hypothetical protein